MYIKLIGLHVALIHGSMTLSDICAMCDRILLYPGYIFQPEWAIIRLHYMPGYNRALKRCCQRHKIDVHYIIKMQLH